jgi:uncharacterized protein
LSFYFFEKNNLFICIKVICFYFMINVVLGASPNPERYSFKATEILVNEGYNVIPVGVKPGTISGFEIQHQFPSKIKIDTLAMYLSVENQKKYYDLILNNLPRRIIFNPGTYNPDFRDILVSKGVEVINNCVLVMVAGGIY